MKTKPASPATCIAGPGTYKVGKTAVFMKHAKPAKRQYRRRDPSTLKVSKTVAMYEWQWERFDALRGRTARGKFLAAKLKLAKQPAD